ncbi:ankyrin repeat-containing domain protein [Durotheca rogersii]|uniref:ankyrin repeat-containing domain protein n=1 Tax=Durotheca rogersii TaxID=419775 RepID=UPI002220776A|nr:ankyrin repeat-containing domain protein [Durotheca rogersii]KAI5862076.1 ankyrin repeat-containing domain protein [Durotheca rogersii]
MHLVARQGAIETFYLLVDQYEGDLDVVDKQGRKLLHYAAMSGEVDMVRILLDEEPSQLAELDLPDGDGWTPLHWACRSDDNLDIIQILVEKGADVVRETHDGWTPENIAAFHGANDVEGFVKERIATAATPPPRRRWKVGDSAEATCDGCLLLSGIIGPRWRCKDCQDFDYCFKCSWTIDKTHPDHTFTIIPSQIGIPGRRPEAIEDDPTPE